MKKALLILALVLSSFAPLQSQAGELDNIFEDFDHRAYTRDELRFLQLGLAFEGYYHGLLDGAWGAISSRAFEQFSKTEFNHTPLHAHSAVLSISTANRVVENEWTYRYFPTMGLSFLIPEKSWIDGTYSKDFANFEDSASSLKYSITFGDKEWTQGIHTYAERFHELAGQPYTVRKQGFAVTSAQNKSGNTLYVRSRHWKGTWSTLMLSAHSQDAGLLAAVSASISKDPNVRLNVPQSGFMFATAKKAIELFESPEEDAPAQDPQTTHQDPVTEANTTSTGSGFWVSKQGYVLTNAHVIEGCTSVKVNGEPASIVTSSENFDLALLLASPTSNIASFATKPARLNEDIIVAGYPLSFMLGGVNVTRGSVSGMKGLVGDEITMQISAPVQSGNSGGPVVSSSGDVVGVVVAKLDAEVVQDTIGDTPQNINFAIRGEVAKLFLTLNGIEPVLGVSREPFDPVSLAEETTKFTAFIECQ